MQEPYSGTYPLWSIGHPYILPIKIPIHRPQAASWQYCQCWLLPSSGFIFSFQSSGKNFTSKRQDRSRLEVLTQMELWKRARLSVRNSLSTMLWATFLTGIRFWIFSRTRIWKREIASHTLLKYTSADLKSLTGAPFSGNSILAVPR